ncbi:MAG: bifunctional hydroxymethylpyrimidine kinase/phosphomethylpyrimidine kinase [Planctomycetota bacterium]
MSDELLNPGNERILVVAGHDPSGGAGVMVDLEAARALEVDVDAVITADTDQDRAQVRSIGARDPQGWLAEARQRIAKRSPQALKFGLLPGSAHLRAAATLVNELRSVRPDFPVVLDPVIASSSGTTFLQDADVEILSLELLPLGLILTPNLGELAHLSGESAEELALDLDLRGRAARGLVERGARAVVVKGGHGGEDPVCDLICERERRLAWRTRPRVFQADGEAAGIRGSGCRFATVLASGLATGLDLETAADQAGRYVADRIALVQSSR